MNLKDTLLMAVDALNNPRPGSDHHALIWHLRRHAAIEYVAVQSVDMDRTSEHLVTDDLRAAIEASGK